MDNLSKLNDEILYNIDITSWTNNNINVKGKRDILDQKPCVEMERQGWRLAFSWRHLLLIYQSTPFSLVCNVSHKNSLFFVLFFYTCSTFFLSTKIPFIPFHHVPTQNFILLFYYIGYHKRRTNTRYTLYYYYLFAFFFCYLMFSPFPIHTYIKKSNVVSCKINNYTWKNLSGGFKMISQMAIWNIEKKKQECIANNEFC